MQFDVVRAQLSELDEVIAILEGARQWLLSRGIEHQWVHPFPKDWLAKQIQIHEVYLASKKDVTVGTLTIQHSDKETWGEMSDDAGYIHQMAIRREYKGKGLGLQLLHWAEQRIISYGKKYIRLDCGSKNAKLCAYYEKAGYVFQRKVATKYRGGTDRISTYPKRNP